MVNTTTTTRDQVSHNIVTPKIPEKFVPNSKIWNPNLQKFLPVKCTKFSICEIKLLHKHSSWKKLISEMSILFLV